MKPQPKISKTRIKTHRRMKTNPTIAAIVYAASKQPHWLPLAKKIAGSTRNYSSINLMQIDKHTTTGDTVLIVGKVLSVGDLSKKVRICALGISTSAREKLKKTKSEYVSIADEIKINPKAEGLKVLA